MTPKTPMKPTTAPTPPRKSGGRPFGASRLAFHIVKGRGEVVMMTRLHPDTQVRVSVPASTKKLLIQATGGKSYSSAMVALSEWAIQELRRQHRRLVVRDADAP